MRLLLLLLFVMPVTIDVAITGEAVCTDDMRGKVYPLETVDFKEYVKGVLPNEWYPTWNEEALKAGALAVKMYGWSMYETYGFVYDCNWNQVYNPDNRTDATDKAVDDTWNWVLMKSRNVTKSVTKDDLIRTYYDDFPSACATRGHECMPQWGTLIDANNGMGWKDILLKYYSGELINIKSKPCDLFNMPALPYFRQGWMDFIPDNQHR